MGTCSLEVCLHVYNKCVDGREFCMAYTVCVSMHIVHMLHVHVYMCVPNSTDSIVTMIIAVYV